MKHALLLLAFFIYNTTNSQTIEFPPSKSGTFQSYTSKSGITINVGDKIELGLPFGGNQFVFINQNRIGINANLSASIVEIIEIEVSGNDKKGYKAYAKFKGFGATPVFINLEPAINSQEIIKNQ